MKHLLLMMGLLGLLSPSLILAQDDCPCCTAFHQQFDFWVGDWAVYDTTGKLLGENTITKLEDGCLLNEHWRGAAGTTGRSYNYFNQTDSSWNQVWVDNQGGHLLLSGNAQPNQMTLRSELLPGQQVDWYRNRITWTKEEDGSVIQRWDILDQGDQLLATVFYGVYRRKEN